MHCGRCDGMGRNAVHRYGIHFWSGRRVDEGFSHWRDCDLCGGDGRVVKKEEIISTTKEPN